MRGVCSPKYQAIFKRFTEALSDNSVARMFDPH